MSQIFPGCINITHLFFIWTLASPAKFSSGTETWSSWQAQPVDGPSGYCCWSERLSIANSFWRLGWHLWRLVWSRIFRFVPMRMVRKDWPSAGDTPKCVFFMFFFLLHWFSVISSEVLLILKMRRPISKNCCVLLVLYKYFPSYKQFNKNRFAALSWPLPSLFI